MVTGTTAPRLVVAAPASGHGKTTVATGLMAALRRAGLRVSPHKVGPDYIDPGYHTLAAGRPGRNLDPVLVGEHRIEPLFLHGFVTPTPADVAIVEGVMGLYDGRDTTSFGSTAHVARLLDAPVVLVVDGTAQGRSVAAVVHGFASYARVRGPVVRLGGVILNRVGSDRHERILREALADLGVPVFGALRRDDTLTVPSRHLGLVPAAERSSEATAAVERIADAVAASVDLTAVMELARGARPLAATAWTPPPSRGTRRPVVAVAGGPAFTFGYAEHTEVLAAAGAEVAVVDPLRDESLPEGSAALVIGGGFPEVHAADLAANAPLRHAVAALAARGAPIIAECAGLLYLAEELDGAPMCGVLPARARMSPRLTLGYREAKAAACGPVFDAGTSVSAHEFHRTVIEPGCGERAAWSVSGGGDEGFVSAGVHASYLHLHWAGLPELASRVVAAA